MQKGSLILCLFFTAVFLTLSTTGKAQCKSFSVNHCIKGLSSYYHNGQITSLKMLPGEKAELMITFYSGQDYRLIICGHPVLGSVNYNVYDVNRNLIYNSTTSDYFGSYDFKVASTQQLTIEVEIPKSDSKTNIVETGCVSMLVGFKM